MPHKDFFSHIATHHKAQLPFVAYRRPNEHVVNAMLQNNQIVHTVDDFSESGFIFSPFESDEKTIIFPSENSKHMSSEYVVSIENEITLNPNVKSDVGRQQHINLVKEGINSIEDQLFQKVVLSRVETVSVSEFNTIQIFKSLLNQYPTAFVYIWFHPMVGLWLGATPETFMHIEGRRFKTMSLAGTQPYVKTKKVEWDSKNGVEQQLVTDYILNTLDTHIDQLTVSEVNTIKAGQLLHLQTTISGVLKSSDLKVIISALHPTPAVCGLPMKTAKNFILNNENYNREFYSGFLGELNIHSANSRNRNKRNVENNVYKTVKKVSHLYVNIRCMQIKNNLALIYVGGGITKDSHPVKEWEETVIKSYTMKRIVG